MADKKALKIDRTPVNSSNIVSVGYDVVTKTLDVEFYTGRLYRYENVPEDTYNRLKSSSSVGSFFQKNVARSFPYKKLA